MVIYLQEKRYFLILNLNILTACMTASVHSSLPALLPTTVPIQSYRIQLKVTYFIDVLHRQYRVMCTNATDVPHLATSPPSPLTGQCARSRHLKVPPLFPPPISSLTVLSLQEAGVGLLASKLEL